MKRFLIVFRICIFQSLFHGSALEAAEGMVSPPGTVITYSLPTPQVRFVTKFSTASTSTVTVSSSAGLPPFQVPPYNDRNSYSSMVVSDEFGSTTATYSPGAHPENQYFPDWEITTSGIYRYPGNFLNVFVSTALAGNMELFFAQAIHVSSNHVVTQDVLSGKLTSYTLSGSVPPRTVTTVRTTLGSVTWEEVPPVALFVSDGAGGNSRQDCEYKIVVSSTLSGRKVYWLEIFAPAANPELRQEILKEWTVTGSESPTFTLRATNEGEATVELFVLTGELAVDANRDGKIKLASEDASDATSATHPHRFWINDDDDAGDTRGTDIPDSLASDANFKDQVVNGTRDLVDFFPVFLNLKQLLTLFPPTTPGVKYKLKQADGALNFMYTSLSREATLAGGGALSYQREIFATGFGDQFDKPPGAAATHHITAAGVELSSVFLGGTMNNDWGVLLVEGRASTVAPMVLSVEQGTEVLAEIKLELRIGNVEDMFRHVDLAHVPTNYDGSETVPPETAPAPRIGDPGDAWPDSLTNGKYFVFVHGFNIDGQGARGWETEIFKRLHALGSNARYVGVTWNGATGVQLGGSYTNYHQAVFNAFQTGDALGTALKFIGPAEVIVAAHSLGTVVVSHAVQSAGFAPTRYFMINAATPVEACAPDEVTSAQQHDMIEREWKTYASRLYAANWHLLFPPSDHRSELTWESQFIDVAPKTHHFYSSGDDVVADSVGTDTASIAANLLRQGFDFSTGAWKLQELVKGVSWFDSGASLFMDRGQAGWGFNSAWYKVRGQSNSGPITSRRFPDEADDAEVPTAALRTQPFFLPFLDPNLTSSNASLASATAEEKKVRYDLLARGIPAKSYAMATRSIVAFEPTSRNFDMEAAGRIPNLWPSEGHTREGTQGRWLHSDFKNVALPYVHRMFEEMIERGTLK